MGFRGKYKNRFIRVTVFIQKSGAYGISGTVTSCKRKCSEITEPSLCWSTGGIIGTSSQKTHGPLMHGSLVWGPFESLLGHLGCVGPSLADTPPTIHLPQLASLSARTLLNPRHSCCGRFTAVFYGQNSTRVNCP